MKKYVVFAKWRGTAPDIYHVKDRNVMMTLCGKPVLDEAELSRKPYTKKMCKKCTQLLGGIEL